MADTLSIDQLSSLAREHGFSLAGVLTKEQALSALVKEKPRLEIWQERGFAAEMEYMKRTSDLFTELEHFLPGVRSLVVLAASYAKPEPTPRVLPEAHARVARYAWGRDYHRQLKKRIARFMRDAESTFPRKISWRSFSDAVPLLERALAGSALSGFVGKNSMFIAPGFGSYSFLAEILIDCEIEGQQNLASATSCKTCTRCLSACPTEAFESAFVLNANKCISYLTIEKSGPFDSWQERAIGEWVFGCDICQEVCPFNHRGVESGNIPEFGEDFGVGPFLSLSKVLKIRDKEEFSKNFAGTALMRAGREKLLRNAACVAANTKALSAIPELIEVFKHDASVILREQSARSLEILSQYADGLDRKRISLLQASNIYRLQKVN